jgi:hypothetical protein
VLHFGHAVDMILDMYLRDELVDNPKVLSGDAVEISCALIHAPYILTNRDRGQMIQKHQSGHISCCAAA